MSLHIGESALSCVTPGVHVQISPLLFCDGDEFRLASGTGRGLCHLGDEEVSKTCFLAGLP